MRLEKFDVNIKDSERVTINGDIALIERIGADGKVWRSRERNIKTELKHKKVNDYIKHLKYLDYKEA